MKPSLVFGSTLFQRCGWVRQIHQLIRSGRLPGSYQITLENISRAYLFSGLIARHKLRLFQGFAPFVIQAAITDWCPNQCRYCYNQSGLKGAKATHMNLPRLNIILDEVQSAYGIRFAVITGGEPFPRILKLERPDFVFFVYTSGHITDTDCRELLQRGNIIPVLTIVDTNSQVHDHIRGKGNFDSVMAARELLLRHRLPFGWSITASRANFEQIVSQNLLGQLNGLGANFIRSIPCMPVGRMGEELSLSATQRAQVERAVRLARAAGIEVFDYIGDSPYTCPAGADRLFSILPHGSDGIRVSPCIFMQEEISVPLVFHENGQSSLLSVLRKNPLFQQTRQLARHSECLILENPESWVALIKDGGNREESKIA